MPFAYIMGVDWKDSFLVAELLGIKTFINEFVAYKRLGKIIENRIRKIDGDKMSVSLVAFMVIYFRVFSLIK